MADSHHDDGYGNCHSNKYHQVNFYAIQYYFSASLYSVT